MLSYATFTRTALDDQLNRSLKIAASNTAQQVDSFLQSNLGLIIQNSSTQQLADYLEQDEKYTLSPTTRDQTQIFFELVKNTRRYRLEGYETKWELAGTRRSAFFTNLKPGKYTFVVQACDDFNPQSIAASSQSAIQRLGTVDADRD